jgi:hypothetical protein
MLKSSKQKGLNRPRRIKLLCYNLITAGKLHHYTQVDTTEKVTANSVVLFATLTDNNYS